MEITKRIVCLANSRKLSGRCVAGRELIGGRPRAWIRPVSDRPNEAVSKDERQYADGSDPQLLDIIDVPLLEARPKDHQQENWLLDSQKYWTKVGHYSRSDLDRLAVPSGILWRNESSTRSGHNDRIPLNMAADETSSLKLIRVDGLQLKVFSPSEAFGNNKRRVQARFQFSDVDYALWVTDPDIESEYLAREDGDYSLLRSYLTISLGEPSDDGYCYKLVAAVIRAGD